jgi:Caspase domain
MLRCIFAAMAMLLTVAEASAGGRVALVVGISNYEHAGRLANTLNDANDMAASLKRLGFDVDTVLDPGRQALEAALRRYGDRSASADVSLFYYSGHATESGAHNWLLPASANPMSERDLRFEAIDLSAVQEQSDAAKVEIILLDACRDNPFARRMATRRGYAPRGLARFEVPAGGILVAFSTGPGQVAIDGLGGSRNSPFTAALLKHLETPGLEIKSLLGRVTRDVAEQTQGKQHPWQNSSLEGDFYFAQPTAAAQAAAQSLDSTYWNSIRDSRTAAEFESYLARFPSGVFVELAKSRLAALNQQSAPQPSYYAPQPRAPQLPPQAPGGLPSSLPSAVPPDVRPADPGETAGMVERARALIAVGDVPAARIILRRAYERGDVQAALELGGTYDPVRLKRLSVIVNNSLADAGQARAWYVKAADAGSAEAIYRINELESQNR